MLSVETPNEAKPRTWTFTLSYINLRDAVLSPLAEGIFMISSMCAEIICYGLPNLSFNNAIA